MEKPKDCEVCPFFILDGAITDDNEWVSYSVCDLLGKTIGDADMLNDCPLIEIDLVRCGECKHWQGNKDEDDLTDECRWITDELPNADDFCSYGERRMIWEYISIWRSRRIVMIVCLTFTAKSTVALLVI